MKRILSVLLIGITVILLYDTVSAVVSRSTGVDYGWFGFGSLAVYLIFGFLVAKRSSWINGMAAGAAIGLIESTLGWAISWMIGPGKPSMDVNVFTIGLTVAFVTLSAAVVGLVGGLLSLLVKRNA
jgi:hypothetical protein